MKVVLLDNVKHVGQKYDVKEVAPGYALNFLLPRKLAKVATPKIVSEIEKKREEERGKMTEEQKMKQQKITSLKDKIITLKKDANEQGHLFAAIHQSDVVKALKDQFDVTFEEKDVTISKELKEVGENTIKIGDSDIKVNILAS